MEIRQLPKRNSLLISNSTLAYHFPLEEIDNNDKSLNFIRIISIAST